MVSPSLTGKCQVELNMSSLILLTYLILLASLFGNSVLIHIIRADDSLKTTINYLILNQACADLWFTLIGCIGITLQTDQLGYIWFRGNFATITCRSFLSILVIPSLFTSWILVAIAVERFYAVTQPLRRSPLSQHLRKTVVFMWIWSLAGSTNVLVNGMLFKAEPNYYCTVSDKWIIPRSISAIVNVFIPVIIMAVLYTIVCRTLWSREIPGEGTNQNQGQNSATKIARRVSIMMIVIVVLYIVCCFPYDVNLALTSLGFVEVKSNADRFLIMIAITYSSINPYLYLTFNQKFRHAFKKSLPNCFRRVNILRVPPFRSQSVELKQISKTEQAPEMERVGRY